MNADNILKLASYYNKRCLKLAEDKTIDLSKADDFSFSSIMRQLRKNTSEENVMSFLRIYHNLFLIANKLNADDADKLALKMAIEMLKSRFNVKENKSFVKNASSENMGDPILVGKYLSNIIRFTMNRISPEKRSKSIAKLRAKIHDLNASELANKKMPNSASMGQAITFVKNILFNQDPSYIRKVINTIVREL